MPYGTKVTFIAANETRHLLFFEKDAFVYNYKTAQWSSVPAYSGIGMFTIRSLTDDIGLVRISAGSVDLQLQAVTDDAQSAELETGAVDLNQGGRTVVNGIRPLINGGTTTVRVGSQNNPGDTVSYSTSTSLNSRTQFANIRKEGRYVRTEVTVTGGFNQIMGADVDFEPQGQV